MFKDRIKSRIKQCALPSEFQEVINRWTVNFIEESELCEFIKDRMEEVGHTNPKFKANYDQISQYVEELEPEQIRKPVKIKNISRTILDARNKVLEEILELSNIQLVHRQDCPKIIRTQLVIQTLKDMNWSRKETANALGMPLRTLQNQLNKWVEASGNKERIEEEERKIIMKRMTRVK